ncbi:hypothetical protein IQ07DRAFT_382197 [Pyrenochaeta sp. DS3sAY3a]|nr:hypothetical protein IQ07DRAFT_382197 [Pyrenochaeta sp. DS3sAY3a]
MPLPSTPSRPSCGIISFEPSRGVKRNRIAHSGAPMIKPHAFSSSMCVDSLVFPSGLISARRASSPSHRAASRPLIRRAVPLASRPPISSCHGQAGSTIKQGSTGPLAACVPHGACLPMGCHRTPAHESKQMCWQPRPSSSGCREMQTATRRVRLASRTTLHRKAAPPQISCL